MCLSAALACPTVSALQGAAEVSGRQGSWEVMGFPVVLQDGGPVLTLRPRHEAVQCLEVGVQRGRDGMRKVCRDEVPTGGGKACTKAHDDAQVQRADVWLQNGSDRASRRPFSCLCDRLQQPVLAVPARHNQAHGTCRAMRDTTARMHVRALSGPTTALPELGRGRGGQQALQGRSAAGWGSAEGTNGHDLPDMRGGAGSSIQRKARATAKPIAHWRARAKPLTATLTGSKSSSSQPCMGSAGSPWLRQRRTLHQ